MTIECKFYVGATVFFVKDSKMESSCISEVRATEKQDGIVDIKYKVDGAKKLFTEDSLYSTKEEAAINFFK